MFFFILNSIHFYVQKICCLFIYICCSLYLVCLAYWRMSTMMFKCSKDKSESIFQYQSGEREKGFFYRQNSILFFKLKTFFGFLFFKKKKGKAKDLFFMRIQAHTHFWRIPNSHFVTFFLSRGTLWNYLKNWLRFSEKKKKHLKNCPHLKIKSKLFIFFFFCSKILGNEWLLKKGFEKHCSPFDTEEFFYFS